MRIPRRRPTPLPLLLTVAVLAACGGNGSPAAPDDLPDASGRWEGSAEGRSGDLHRVTLSLEQAGDALTGTIRSFLFRTHHSYSVAGTVGPDGRVRLTAATISQGGCLDITAELTLDRPERRLTGTYLVDGRTRACGRVQAGKATPRPFSLQRR